MRACPPAHPHQERLQVLFRKCTKCLVVQSSHGNLDGSAVGETHDVDACAQTLRTHAATCHIEHHRAFGSHDAVTIYGHFRRTIGCDTVDAGHCDLLHSHLTGGLAVLYQHSLDRARLAHLDTVAVMLCRRCGWL